MTVYTPLDWFYVLIKRKGSRKTTLSLNNIVSQAHSQCPLERAGCISLAITDPFERAAKRRLWVKFLTSLPPMAFALGLKGWWLLLQSPWILNVSFLNTKHNYVLMSTRNLSLTFDWPIPESVFLRYCQKWHLKQLQTATELNIEYIYDPDENRSN